MRAGSHRGRRIQLGVGFAVASRAATTVINILIVPVLTGYLGKEGFGLNVTIASTLAWINLGNFGITQGIQMTLARAFTVEPPERQRRMVSSAFILMTVAGAAVAAMFLLAFPHVPWTRVFPAEAPDLVRQTTDAVLVSFLNIALFLPLSVVPSMMNARQETHLSALFYACITVTTSAGALAGCLADGGLVGVVIGQAAGNLAGGYLFSLFYLARGGCENMRPRRRDARWASVWLLLRRSAPFTLTQICVLILMQSDNFIIMHFISAGEVTPYNIGHRFFLLLYSAFGLLIQPLWAAYTNAQVQGDYAWIRDVHGKLVRAFVVLLPVAAAGVILFARPLMVLWVGEEVAPGTSLTLCLAALYALRLWTDIHGTLINALSQTHRILFNAFLHPVITLAGYALLIRPMGATGMALGGVMGYAACIAWYAPWLANRILKEEPEAR